MRKVFNPERFGMPQAVALALLLLFFGQCAWFVSHVPLTQIEAAYIVDGISTITHAPRSEDPLRAPIVSIVAVAGVAPAIAANHETVDQFYLDRHRWLIRAPFLLSGLLLGASLWYVARRLYGNAGGYTALGLYAFSPGMIAHSSMVGPEILGAWGAFGLIFTAIATAHTLYAPREVVLWNWKRITLLGISIGVAVGAQWALAWLLVPALLFMFWAVPHRRGAAAVIVLAACGVGFVLLDAAFGAHLTAMFHALGSARWLGFGRGLPATVMFPALRDFFLNASPAAVLAFAVALLTWMAWSRTRFFGNTAPLIVLALLMAMGMLLPRSGGAMFFFYALPFVMIFSAGVFADLVETKRPDAPIALLFALVVGQAIYSVGGLMRIFSGGVS